MSNTDFPLYFNLKNKYRRRLNLSNHLHVAPSNCVPGYERIISEQQKTPLSLFLMSSKVWNVNSKTDCFLLYCQLSYVLRVLT